MTAQSLPDERIRFSLGPDGGRRSVAGENRNLIAERIELLLDPAKQKIAISPGQVPTPNPADKQNIPANQKFGFPPDKAEASRAMSRHFQHFHFETEKIASRGRLDQEI